MNIPQSPYISRVKIINFRNFKNIDVELNHKQIIIGENNVGKTNFLRALQIILDPKLSDEDRFLLETDFFDGLSKPMEMGEEVLISIEIRGFDHNKTILSILDDATVSTNPPTIKLTYKYFAKQREDGKYDYQFAIYQGDKEDVPFTHYHRKFLNMNVINAIRDVESEMKHLRKSPVNLLLKQYDIRKEELESIAAALKQKSDEVLSIDELIDLTENINNRFSAVIGSQIDSKISLETIDVDPNRILNTLKLMIGEKRRYTNDISLGINNILYISLILLALEDKTVPSILKEDKYVELLKEEGGDILRECYEINDKKNYILKKELDKDNHKLLYEFMDNFSSSSKGFTILAIEEPESHLHPALQRIIYKDVMKKNTSILMTTHSPYITSVAPINSIVHLKPSNTGTKINTTASLNLESKDKMDLQRYIDVKRGELYFGRGVILVEGVAEEYLVPSFADKLGMPLDQKGIICCNVNSTNFKPYVKFLDTLGIPYVVITDGDFYTFELKDGKEKKIFGRLSTENNKKWGWDGNDRIRDLIITLNKVPEKDIPSDYSEQDKLFNEHGFYIGTHTFEVEIMDKIETGSKEESIIINLFNVLTMGGQKQKENFKKELQNGEYISCLNKIESSHSGIGKGRFAQHLSIMCTEKHIPDYIKDAIISIFTKVDEM
jgi:putative ATP-dependent endonuclease of the OLD family